MKPAVSRGVLCQHGGNLLEFAARYQKKENEIFDFSSNVNPLGPPDSVRRLLPELVEDLSRYPDPACTVFCREITQRFPVLIENVIAGNGSMGLLALAVRVLKPSRALLVEPCFTEYRRLLELEGAGIRSVLLEERDDFRFPLEEILKSLEGTDLLILGQPNNPTGTCLEPKDLMTLLFETSRRGIFVILDEAFSDWKPEFSLSGQVREHSGLLVVRSLTKFYSLAGIRSGFALGPKAWIEKMKVHQEAWSCNRLAQELSVEALRDKSFVTRTLAWFQNESSWFFNALSSLPFLKVYPSHANFHLIRIEGPAEGFLIDFLGSRGIYVRLTPDFPGLGPGHYRLALRLRPDHEFLIESLKAWKGSCS